MTDNERELLNLLYNVEDYLYIMEDYYCNLDGPMKKPAIEQKWLDKRTEIHRKISKGE